MFSNEIFFKDEAMADLPRSVDWRTKNVVSRVKQQGACGSCWAITAVGVLESAESIRTGLKRELSFQQVLDCTQKNYGCSGGRTVAAYKYAQKTAVHNSELYPYTQKKDVCREKEISQLVEEKNQLELFNPNISDPSIDFYQPVMVGDFKWMPANRPQQLKAMLNVSPVGMVLSANMPVFKFYQKGVLDGKECGTDARHAVMAVGYGKD